MIQSPKNLLPAFLLGIVLVFHPQNASAKFVPESVSMARTNSSGEHFGWRTVEIKPGPHAPKIHFYQKLNPVWWFQNADDSVPPDWYRPNEPHRRLKWSFRNPFHNFDFFVIGVADRKFHRSGRFPNQNSDPRGGWDFEAARYGVVWLPFVAYHKPTFDFYFGWRNRGNFGIKINVRSKPKAEANPSSAVVPGAK